MRRTPPDSHARSRGLALVLAAALLPALGCASVRERLPELPDAPRPAWLAAPALPSWRDLPLVSRLGLGRGEVRGTVGLAHARASVEGPPMVVFLEPVEAGRSPAPGAAAATVRQREQRFSPAFLVIAAGQSVVFSNEDDIYHRIFSYSKTNAFDTEVLERGQSNAVRFEEPGEVHFYCALHPEESGSVYVTPSPWFSLVEAAGTYRIAEVPPGRYHLRVWSEAGGLTSHDVTVRAGDSASVDLPARAD